MFKNTKLNKTYNLLLKLIIISVSFGYIIYQLFFNENYQKVINHFTSDFSFLSILKILSLMFVLMLLNLSIEAYKWRLLIKKIEEITFIKAFKAILAGLSIGAFTPNRIGEFLGRVFILQKANPWKAIFISLLCSMSQLMITLLLGSISLCVYFFVFFAPVQGMPLYIIWIVTGILFIINFIIFSVYFNISFISKLIDYIIKPKWKKMKGYLKVFSYFTISELRNVFLLSLLRYLVFSTQFYVLFRFFGIALTYYEGLFLISLIYFILSVVPSITLADIGIRGSVAIAVFDYYFNTTLNAGINYNIAVVAASSVLWIINIAIPSIIGNLFVMKLNFFKTKNA